MTKEVTPTFTLGVGPALEGALHNVPDRPPSPALIGPPLNALSYCRKMGRRSYPTYISRLMYFSGLLILPQQPLHSEESSLIG